MPLPGNESFGKILGTGNILYAGGKGMWQMVKGSWWRIYVKFVTEVEDKSYSIMKDFFGADMKPTIIIDAGHGGGW